MTKRLVRFDWAIKKLLKNRADFDILEGFLTVLLGQEIKILEILDSESEKETADDKHNRVDLLVRNQYDERIIIEVQNSKELDYFHRMVYGTAKGISQHIKKGSPYSTIKKVISITIAYFDLGHGEDYVYHGTNQFKGIHKADILTLADEQIELYEKTAVHEIFPEYWIIKAEKFNDKIEDKLDEWIYFLKNSEVRDDFTAPGLDAAKEKLDELRMTEKERREYERYLKRLMDIASANHTKKYDIQKLLRETEQKGIELGMEKGMEKGIEKGMEQGLEKGKKQGVELAFSIFKLYRSGKTSSEIAEIVGLSPAEVEEMLEELT